MNIKGKYFIVLVLTVCLFIYLKDVYIILNKYPNAYIHLKQNFSLLRLYNTYETLSAGQYKAEKNSPASRNCSPLSLDLPKDEHLIKQISDASYLVRRKHNPNAVYRDETTFTYIGAQCTSKSTLINFKYKDNEAHATFSCERGDLVQEFTYSSTGDKCAVIEYKKEWGIKPVERTLGYTMDLKLF